MPQARRQFYMLVWLSPSLSWPDSAHFARLWQSGLAARHDCISKTGYLHSSKGSYLLHLRGRHDWWHLANCFAVPFTVDISMSFSWNMMGVSSPLSSWYSIEEQRSKHPLHCCAAITFVLSWQLSLHSFTFSLTLALSSAVVYHSLANSHSPSWSRHCCRGFN